MNIEILEEGVFVVVIETKEVKEVDKVEDDTIYTKDFGFYTIDELREPEQYEVARFLEMEYWEKYDRDYGEFEIGDIVIYQGELYEIHSFEKIGEADFVVTKNGRTIFDVMNMRINVFRELRMNGDEFN